MASSTTTWKPLHRRETERYAWLLDNGEVMEEPALEESNSGRRVRVAAVPDVADYSKNLTPFLAKAAAAAASQKGRRLWMALGQQRSNQLDQSHTSKVTLDGDKLVPHFLSRPANSSRRYGVSDEAAWRFRHQEMPIEAQIECTLTKDYSDVWKVSTRLVFPCTWPENAAAPSFHPLENGNFWPTMINGATIYGELATRLTEWSHANPIDWTDGFAFGVEKFDNERSAVNAFAKVIRAVNNLDEIEIPNLLNVGTLGNKVNQITMLSLRMYKTNATQDLLDILSDYLTGEPLVDQIKAKWKELASLFRGLGMVVEDPKDTDWWDFIVQGSDHAPLSVSIGPVTDETSKTNTQHSVMVNLATGTIVVACSRSATRDETAVQWETSLIKAEMTGQKDRFLAFADHYEAERQEAKARELMDSALKDAKITKGKPE